MTKQGVHRPTIISWGIIGCGDVTERKSGPAFNKVPHSRLVAVMRRDAAKAADYAGRHHVPKWYSNAAQLIDDPEINAVYVATPPLFHEEFVIEALKKGKFVYVEKPVTLSVDSCQKMIAAAEKYNGKVCVAHYRRALPMFLELKSVLDRQLIGKVKMIRLNLFRSYMQDQNDKNPENWRIIPEISGGGLFFDLAPHQLDIMHFLFGDALDYVGASAHQTNYYAAEDTVSGMIRFDGNILFQGNWCFTMPDFMQVDRCEVIGEKGLIEFPVFGHYFSLQTGQRKENFEFQHPENIQLPMIQNVVGHFLEEEENPCSLQEAKKSLKIMEVFLRGLPTGTP
jgi:predicted dehydrogenase